jgi:hypothetical protein
MLKLSPSSPGSLTTQSGFIETEEAVSKFFLCKEVMNPLIHGFLTESRFRFELRELR